MGYIWDDIQDFAEVDQDNLNKYRTRAEATVGCFLIYNVSIITRCKLGCFIFHVFLGYSGDGLANQNDSWNISCSVRSHPKAAWHNGMGIENHFKKYRLLFLLLLL